MVMQTKPAPGGDPLKATPFYNPANNPALRVKRKPIFTPAHWILLAIGLGLVLYGVFAL